MNVRNGFADDDISCRLFDDCQSLQNRHAAAHQSTERSGESRDGDFTHHGADCRHLELELVPCESAEFGPDKKVEQDHENSNHDQGSHYVLPDQVAGPHDKPGEGGQLRTFRQALKHFLELGNYFDEQNHQNCHSHNHHRYRVKHSSNDLAFDLLSLFHELSKTVEHDFQHTTQLTGLHHVHEQAVKNLRMLSQSFGERTAPFNGQGEFPDDVLQGYVLLLLFEHAQATKKRQTGIDESSELASERAKHLRLHLPAQARDFDLNIGAAALLLGFGCWLALLVGATLFLGLVDLHDFGGVEPHLFHAADCLVLRTNLEGTLGLFAVGIHRYVTIFRHT